MSVIVMGMDMPTVCVTDDGWYGNCPIDRVWCAMRFKPEYEEGQRIIDEITGKRPDWCPIRPLPEKHGRLIDANALVGRFEPKQAYFTEAIINKLGTAPVIVEAEGE